MWDSGYVVVPTAAGCCLNITLQVDPKVRGAAECVWHGICSSTCIRLPVTAIAPCFMASPHVLARFTLRWVVLMLFHSQRHLRERHIPSRIHGLAAFSCLHLALGPMPCSIECLLSVILQGWIPTSVVNFSLEAIPLNIQRIRAALDRMPPALLQQLSERNKHQAAACKQLPPIETLGTGSAGLYMAYSSNKQSSASSGSSNSGASEESTVSRGSKPMPRVVRATSGDVAGGVHWSPDISGASPDSSAGSKWQSVDGTEGEDEESSEWFDA